MSSFIGYADRIFDLGVYTTDFDTLTAKLYYIGGKDPVPARDRHPMLKHMNPVLYDHYAKSFKPMTWAGTAWVCFFASAKQAVACYTVVNPGCTGVYNQPLGGYEVLNEAVLKSFRGRRVASQALFPSIADAVARIEAIRAGAGMYSRGYTVSVAVDAHKPSTRPTIDFLVNTCGFALVPPHWKTIVEGKYSTAYAGNERTFLFALTEHELRALGAIHATPPSQSATEFVLSRNLPAQ